MSLSLIEELRANAAAHPLDVRQQVLADAAEALESQVREIHRLGLMVSQADFNYDCDRSNWQRELAALKAQPAAVACANDWFLSLEPGRQAVLREDKWLLADAAFKAGQSLNSSLVSAGESALRAAVTPDVLEWVRCGLAANNRLVDGDHPALQKLRAALTAPAPNHGEQVRVPEGYVLAPQEINLSASDIELINGMCGDGNEESGYGPYQDGTLYIGYAQQDDGSQVFGLHISCDECPEEGVTTLAEFATTPSAGPAPGECVAVPVEALEQAEEGLQVLDSLIENIQESGNYSSAATVNFLNQSAGCFYQLRALLAQHGKGVGDE